MVEEPADIPALEKAGAFTGRYHVLGGKLSPMHGEGPADLKLEPLRARIRRDGVREVILALNTDVESDATAAYLRELLQAQNLRVTRLAFGLPAGSGVAYSDPVTLERAIRGRQKA